MWNKNIFYNELIEAYPYIFNPTFSILFGVMSFFTRLGIMTFESYILTFDYCLKSVSFMITRLGKGK